MIRNQYVASAVFDTESEAQNAVRDLRAAGVPDSAVSLIAQDGDRMMTTNGNGEAMNDGGGNMLRGLVGGGALGAGLAVAALAIPGVGPLVAAGAIAASATPAAMVAGAAIGAVAGGFNESLHERGVSSDDTSYYNDRMSSGGTLVAVDDSWNGSNADQLVQILYRNGGHSSTQSRMTAM